MQREAIMRADGQEVRVPLTGRVRAIVHQDDMLIESADPTVTDITPEMTLAEAADIPEDMWSWLRTEPNFVRLWGGLWGNSPLPEKLGTLASKHTAGMILLMLKVLAEGKTPHLLYPETYLHPAQSRCMVSFLERFRDPKRGSTDNDPEAA